MPSFLSGPTEAKRDLTFCSDSIWSSFSLAFIINSYLLVFAGPGKVIHGLSGLQNTSVCLLRLTVFIRSTIIQVSLNEVPSKGMFSDFLISELAPSHPTKNFPSIIAYNNFGLALLEKVSAQECINNGEFLNSEETEIIPSNPTWLS